MLPKQIARFLIFFDICGFNTQSSNSFSDRKATFLITGIHISMAISFAIYEMYYFYGFYNIAGPIETINELVELFAVLCSYLFIIFDSIYQRKAHQHFWTMFQQLDQSVYRLSNVISRSYVVKFFEFFCVKLFIDFLSLEYYGFGYHVDEEHKYLVYVTYMVPVKISQIRIFYYIFCLEIVWFLMKMHELIPFELDRKKWNHNLERFYEMSQLTNEIFGVSQVTTVLICFFILFTDINYLYIHFRDLSTTKLMCKHSH